MHYCEMLVGGGAPGSHDEPCDSPAAVRYQGEWFCEYHYQALVDLDSHWQALFHAADRHHQLCEDTDAVEFEPYEFEFEGMD
jgi:hypothetical protein